MLTSHSTASIKRIDPENLRYFRLEANDCTTKIKAITLPDKEKLADQYKFIKEAVKAYPELYFAKLVILGEGDSAEIILPKFWSAKNGDVYKEILSEKEGPQLMINISGKRQQKYIKSIEELGESYPEYEKRIIDDVQHALNDSIYANCIQ